MSIILIDAGGTISSLPDAGGKLAGGSAGLGGTLAGPVVRQVYAGLSEDMTLADMARVRDAVLAALGEAEVSGVIVAHGTDAMEETAFLIDLSLPLKPVLAKPVIVTGAMLPMSDPQSDGPGNLAAALHAAATPGLAAHGALVVFAGHLIPAALVYKHATTALDGFGWRGGVAGAASGEAISLPATLPRHAPLAAVVPEAACPIIALSGGDDGAMIRAALASGVKGIVLMALGRGNGSAGAALAVAQAVAAGVPVVVASRCPTGATAADYASGQRLAEAGAIFAGGLGATQARILLATLIAAKSSDIAQQFAARGALYTETH